MADLQHLYGACACERNQYIVVIPPSSASLAEVFFDNSSANLISQATPVTAWLRVPLDWYHSTTFAHFPDETHHSIRRTFNTPPAHPSLPSTRRQFCGYCGSHLTAWNEVGFERSADFMDVTLGSLLSESIEKLEELNIVPSMDEDEDGLVEGGYVNDEDHISTKDTTKNEEGLVKGGYVVDEDHISTEDTTKNEEGLVKGGYVVDEDHISIRDTAKNEEGLVRGGYVVDENHISTKDTTKTEGLVKGGYVDDEVHIPMAAQSMGKADKAGTSLTAKQQAHRMQNRGMPYFEEMVENSRLGRIKRQKGGHTSRDGRTTIQWEVIEVDDDDTTPMDTTADAMETEGGQSRTKRQKRKG